MQIDLSDNKIADGLDTLVKQAPGITHLHLAGNKIKDVDALKPLVRPFPLRLPSAEQDSILTPSLLQFAYLHKLECHFTWFTLYYVL